VEYLHEASGRAKTQLGIDAAFEAIRRFAAKSVSFGAARDAHGVEVRRFEQDVGGRVTDFARRAAHDAGEPEDLVVPVDDDAVFAGVA